MKDDDARGVAPRVRHHGIGIGSIGIPNPSLPNPLLQNARCQGAFSIQGNRRQGTEDNGPAKAALSQVTTRKTSSSVSLAVTPPHVFLSPDICFSVKARKSKRRLRRMSNLIPVTMDPAPHSTDPVVKRQEPGIRKAGSGKATLALSQSSAYAGLGYVLNLDAAARARIRSSSAPPRR
jgi:hypothetical protein